MRKLKDDNKTREIQNYAKSSRLSKMARVAEGENFRAVIGCDNASCLCLPAICLLTRGINPTIQIQYILLHRCGSVAPSYLSVYTRPTVQCTMYLYCTVHIVFQIVEWLHEIP